VTPGNALENILERIKRAEILIFDITDFTPNVMWELGIAMAIKEEEKIIVIRKSSEKEIQTQLPFNIYYHRVSFNYNQKTLDKLRDGLKEVMRDINRKSSIRDNPIKDLEVRSLNERATEAIEKKDWPIASLLFKDMNEKEPKNWYIFTRWGVMYRDKGEFESAEKKFQEALNFTKYDEERALVYIERALLYQMNHQTNTAEDWLKKAEKIDNQNKYLYMVWAELYEELKDYHNAQVKIIKILKEIDENDAECQLRYEYYVRKITRKDFNLSFEEFKKIFENEERRRKIIKAGKTSTSPSDKSFPKLPWAITKKEIDSDYIDKVVEGTVNGTRPYGVFVTLSRDFSGLIHWKTLESGFEDRYPVNKKIPVKIKGTSIDGRNQRVRVVLELAQKDV
jgi:tetratricopeptide (TPR) repeat protein